MRAIGCHACSLMSHSTGRPARRQHALFSPATLGGECETAAGAMYSDDFLSDLPPSPHIPNASHHVRAAPPHEHGGVFDDVKIVLRESRMLKHGDFSPQDDRRDDQPDRDGRPDDAEYPDVDRVVGRAGDLLSRPPHWKCSDWGPASGSEGVWGERGAEEGCPVQDTRHSGLRPLTRSAALLSDRAPRLFAPGRSRRRSQRMRCTRMRRRSDPS